MKAILFGYGSIGQRHAANLKTLRPDVEIEVMDPPKKMTAYGEKFDAAIISSPTKDHADAMYWLGPRSIPFYVEKPIGVTELLKYSFAWPVAAVGHQYRFHREMANIRDAAARTGVLHFHARDDLLSRYGPDVDGVMAAHPIDTALWLLGPALSVGLVSDGVALTGKIEHERGYSTHDYRLDSGPRVSTVASGKTFDLPANNWMYLDCLRAWLEWVEGGSRDPRTCTLAEGLAVMEVLAKVKHTTGVQRVERA